MDDGFKVTGGWLESNKGDEYVAQATGADKKIIATVTIAVPLEVGMDFVQMYGSDELKQQVAQQAEDMVRQLAKARTKK